MDTEQIVAQLTQRKIALEGELSVVDTALGIAQGTLDSQVLALKAEQDIKDAETAQVIKNKDDEIKHLKDTIEQLLKPIPPVDTQPI